MATTYEEKRLENIKQNLAILEQLGLPLTSKVLLGEVEEPEPSQKRKQAKTEKVETVGWRKSSRIKGILVEKKVLNQYPKEPKFEFDSPFKPPANVKKIQTSGPSSGNARTRSSNSPGTQLQIIDPKSTRAVDANVGKFKLGVEIADFGKAAVIAMAGNGYIYKFNKYSGVTEWQNYVFLWVNLPDANSKVDGRYENTFFDSGRRMQWYGGSKMHADSPIVQRLKRVIDEGSSNIMVFARREGRPYFSLGKVKAYQVDLTVHPISIIWSFLDYDQDTSIFTKL